MIADYSEKVKIRRCHKHSPTAVDARYLSESVARAPQNHVADVVTGHHAVALTFNVTHGGVVS